MSRVRKIFEEIFDFKISIKEISLAGMIMALWIICRTFLTIDLKVMQENWTYIWMILIGLIFKPFIGILLGTTADTISVALSKIGIAQWTWSFALLPAVIYIITYSFRKMFTTKNEKLWWVMVSLSIGVSSLLTFILLVIRNNMDIGLRLDLSDSTIKIIIWTSWAIMALIQIISLAWYRYKPTSNLRWIISSYSLVVIIVVISLWIWGPINMYIWADTHNIGFKLPSYEILLFSRIVKSPIIIPIYTFFVATIYKVAVILIKSNSHSKW